MKKKVLLFTVIFIAAAMLFAATGTVFVTASGKKYHRRDCRTLSRSKQLIELTIEQAKAKGYEPCKVCNPGE